MNASQLREVAKQKFRVDLLGFAPISRFKDLPPERNPLSIFPECKTVIVVGRRILRGALRGVEEGTNFWSTYGAFGRDFLLNNTLAKATYDVVCELEDNNIEAVPLFGYGPDAQMSFGVPVAPGKPAPNVILDHDFAAQAAGLGVIGKGGFFLTPEFGPRQRFALILVDHEFAVDDVKKLDFCDNCSECIKACPLGAFDAAGKINRGICKQCKNGAENPGGMGGAVDRFAAICARSCLVSLETRGKLGNKFANQFRKRQPWALDSVGKLVK